jgi:hypothetical protein
VHQRNQSCAVGCLAAGKATIASHILRETLNKDIGITWGVGARGGNAPPPVFFQPRNSFLVIELSNGK